MAIFTKSTAQVADKIIRNIIDNDEQPVMLEPGNDGYHLQKARVAGKHDYNSSWVFAVECDENGVCSFMELEDVADEHGYEIELSKDQRPLIVRKPEVKLCS